MTDASTNLQPTENAETTTVSEPKAAGGRARAKPGIGNSGSDDAPKTESAKAETPKTGTAKTEASGAADAKAGSDKSAAAKPNGGKAKADKTEAKADKTEAKADKTEAKAKPTEAKADKAEAKADKTEAKADKVEAPEVEAPRVFPNPSHALSEKRRDPAYITESFRSGEYPYKSRITRKAYEKHKQELQVELLKVQKWVKDSGQRVVLLFEGRDAAGKGGTIKRFMEHLNPRGARVVALDKPTEDEKGQWYFQRYVSHLPTSGEFVMFDRSWYNRAGVERVMGFCEPQEYLEFMRQTPEVERMLVRSGIRLFKYWFSVTHKEQTTRFRKRRKDPLKQWKLSPIDKLAQEKWDDYTEAKEAMFFYTHTADAPWIVIKSDDKKRARLNCMQHFLHSLPYPDKNTHVVKGPDPLIVGSASEVISQDQHILGKTLHPDDKTD
jgi:polyphosphate kinase 2